MFFGLLAVDDHPCCKMQEVAEIFFLRSIDNAVFSMVLFPEWFHATLKKKTCILSEKFQRVHALLYDVVVTEAGRQAVYDQLHSTNCIEELCEGAAQIHPNAIDWTSDLGKSIDSLMSSLYGSLDLTVFKRGKSKENPTHQLYDEFIKMNSYVCPFCGLAQYKNKRSVRREDFDHYLHSSKYPLAAANMRNLVPTCGICNQDYKRTNDILEDGKAFYPYSVIPAVKLEIDCQTYPEPSNFDDRGKWVVKLELLTPDAAVAPKLTAWNRVYSIRRRLEDEVTEFFEEWMDEVSEDHSAPVDNQEFLDLIASARNKATERSQRRMQPGQIVRVAFYDFMLGAAAATFIESFRQSLNHRYA